jgi:hypothetical protein
MRKRTTGEPYAGEPHVRFGGRGAATPLPDPYRVCRIGTGFVGPGTLLMPPAKLRLAIDAGACDVEEMARITTSNSVSVPPGYVRTKPG